MKLRNLFLLLALASLSVFSSCDEIDELTKFNIDYNSSVTVPATVAINSPISISSPDITTNSSSTFENNNTRADLVESVKLTRMTLTISSPNGADFSFLKAITLSISADGLSDTELASKTTIEDSAITIEMDVEDVELKEYIKKDSFSIKASTTTDEVITSDHIIDISTTFRVDAKILGV